MPTAVSTPALTELHRQTDVPFSRGSRVGDKRVTGVWVSKGAPRLGWCWGGNPHTWLGMATAARRIEPA